MNPKPLHASADPGCDARAQLLERLASGRLELPIMPATAAEVLAACRDDNAGARKVADAVNRDPALVAHVLRVANSAAFVGSEPVLSLQHAVSRMGLSSMAQIALAVCVKGRVFRADSYTHLLDPIWLESTLAAGWAREVARVRRRDTDGAFLVGLLHDVGRPVVLQALVDIERETGRTFGEEQACHAMDYLHPRVGAELMRRWNMPDWMADAIAWHHEPQSAPEHRDEALSTAFAETLAHWTVQGDPEDPSSVLESGTAAALELEPERFDKLLSQRERVLTSASSLS